MKDKAKLPGLSPEDAAIVDVAETETETKILTDADVLEGGLFSSDANAAEPDAATGGASQADGDASTDSAMSPAKDSSPSVPDPAKDAPVAKKTYKVGSKTFESAEELAAYVTGLEQSKLEILDQLTPVEAGKPELDAAEVFFDDPKKAIEMIKEDIRKEMREKEAKQDNERKAKESADKLWKDFYTANPDLSGWEEQVTLALNEVDPNLHPTVGLPKVADRARARIEALRQKLAPAKEVVSGAATVARPTAASVPRIVQSEKPTSFMEELKGLRRAK